MSEETVTITDLPEAMERAERNMRWLREADPSFEEVRIILEVIE